MEKKIDYAPICTLTGTIIHGRGIGKLIGMPTANLKVENESKLPETGVYITKALLNNSTYYGITHIGMRPTIDNDHDTSVETHIFNFNRDIYGRRMEIKLYIKIRSTRKFEDLSQLLGQIRLDCLSAQEYWGIKPVLSGLYMDAAKHQVKIGCEEIYLSSKEFDILYLLYSNPEIVFTREQIYEAVWHEASNGYCHAVENTIFQIRKQLKLYSEAHDFIKTVIGYGYKINKMP